MKKMSRGVRNNNPGNINYNEAHYWKGQLPHDSSIEDKFCRFESPEYGVRALFALLRTYQRRYSLQTVSQLITRWAPPDENNTDDYIHYVAQSLNVSPDTFINLENKTILINFSTSIIKYENNSQPYDELIFEKAWGLL
ncbi:MULTISPECIES: structural protein [Providencia]|uniref:Structural protein n=1 Tax=Providencia stuartii TaxID=588 RepID=A0ABD5LC18_PROST|nr:MULTISPECIES: structural protein [Providencia]ELR5046500.1 structural protein [Providencia rettgeri]ELR5292265.1 structural protein [Providencia stuartii]MCR4180038.1 structural protein [Providencia vermicola]URE77137.1 structural protein [Providencia stuartii]